MSECHGSESHDEVKRDAAWRRTRVELAAYYISEHRGFEPGHEAEDWRVAEMQTDALDEAGA
jgi:hypothetical protein